MISFGYKHLICSSKYFNLPLFLSYFSCSANINYVRKFWIMTFLISILITAADNEEINLNWLKCCLYWLYSKHRIIKFSYIELFYDWLQNALLIMECEKPLLFSDSFKIRWNHIIVRNYDKIAIRLVKDNSRMHICTKSLYILTFL